jgi:hypothetical protein
LPTIWSLLSKRTCLPESWQSYALHRLRCKLFLLPGDLTRPQNRPTLRLKNSPAIECLYKDILGKIAEITPLLG